MTIADTLLRDTRPDRPSLSPRDILRRTASRGALAMGVAIACALCTSLPALSATVRELRAVSDIHGVSLAAAGELVVTQGPAESLEIEAEPVVLAALSTRQSEGILFIEATRSFTTVEPIRYRLSVATLDRVTLAGAAAATVPSLRTDRLTLEMGGNSRWMSGTVDVRSVTVTMNGASRASIDSGRVGNLELRVDGAARFEAPRLATNDTLAFIHGAGTATVGPTRRLTAEVHGGSVLRYRGDPEIVSSVRDAGRLIREGD